MDRQTLRDRVIRFNDDGPEGLIEHKSAGCKPKLNDEQKSQLAQLVEEGPGDHVPGLIRRRCVDPASQVRQRFDVDYHPATIARILHKLDYSHISARPQHPKQDEEVIETLKKLRQNIERRSEKHPCWPPIEIRFQDEARIG